MQLRRTLATVRDPVHFELPWLATVLGDAPHRHPFGGRIGSLGSFLRQAPCSFTLISASVGMAHLTQ